MELQQLLESRQSIRRYKEGDIPESDLREIVSAAGMAPSAKNLQNWHFVIIKNREHIRKIGDLVLEKNESIALMLDQIDKDKADRFRKFCKNFTVFWKETAPVLVATFTIDYLPDGYAQYEMIGGHEDILDDLKLRRNPGMQSVGCAIENFVLKALEKGYGTTILTSPNYAAPEIEAYLKEAGVFEKEGFYLASMLSMGIPEENQKSPPKKALEDIYTLCT